MKSYEINVNLPKISINVSRCCMISNIGFLCPSASVGLGFLARHTITNTFPHHPACCLFIIFKGGTLITDWKLTYYTYIFCLIETNATKIVDRRTARCRHIVLFRYYGKEIYYNNYEKG